MKITEASEASRSSRRHFLRGAGVALALPWMESLASAGRGRRKAGSQGGCRTSRRLRFATHLLLQRRRADSLVGERQRRFDGTRPGSATDDAVPRGHDVFLRGLYNQQAVALDQSAPRPHAEPAVGRHGQSRSARHPRRNHFRSGPCAADRQPDSRTEPGARYRAERTPARRRRVDDLRLGISWATPTKPATKEIYPARTFDLLVGDGKGRQLDRSILDAVLKETHELQPKISRGDRHKLDEYLESIRNIEKRIDRASREERLEGWRPTLTKPNMPRPADDLPQNVPDHMKLMLDLIVLAFQMDKTRIVTLMLNNDLSQMNFRFLEGVQGALHLDLTHNGKAPAAEAMYLKTNQFHVQQFAYLLKRMKEIDEGGTSLLDNSMLLFCSNLFDGDAHSADQMPMLLAGRGSGALKTGRVSTISTRATTTAAPAACICR